jgi:aldehyde dehydrogenase (NAD(P)+)
MSGGAKSRAATSQQQLDEAIAILSEQAPAFVRLSASERAALLRACLPRILQVAAEWVAAACQAKGLRLDEPGSSEECLGGPMVTARCVRLLIRSLDDIHQKGKPQLPAQAFRPGWDGRTEVAVFPGDGYDKAMFTGFSAWMRLQPGISESQAQQEQASFYSQKNPVGGVSLILGAGNVASIPPTDALYKMFHEGKVCLVKLNPVNEYLGPLYEKAFQPLVERGYLRFVYGGAEVGSYLSYHPQIADVHITGSDRTHDLIVWGPPGAERQRRMAASDPLLKKNITSELGCVTPVMIVPGDYSPAELRFLAENIASQVVNNGSFNCNAAKVVVLSAGWTQRETFWQHLREILGSVRPRLAYYPGAQDRYAALTRGKEQVSRLGQGDPTHLSWTLIRGLDAASDNEPLFSTEPFCSLLSEVALPEHDPAGFLKAATAFCNNKLWGTLSASLYIHPKTEQGSEVKAALDLAVAELRYGLVGINHWPGVAYGAMTPPWGGHPSATLANIQSGLGFVHNTFMLEGIEKGILRGPLTVFPKPPWFVTNKSAHKVAERIVRFETEPSWLKVPGIALTALFG